MVALSLLQKSGTVKTVPLSDNVAVKYTEKAVFESLAGKPTCRKNPAVQGFGSIF